MKTSILFLSILTFVGTCNAQNIPSYVPNVDLVAWYALDGNADDATNSHDGVMFNSPNPTTNRFAVPGMALSFNGINQYIRISTLDTLSYKPISYSAWVIVNSYFPSSFGHKFRTIIGRNTTGQLNCAALGFYADNNNNGGQYDNRFLYWRGGGTTGSVPASTSIPQLNLWTHLVYTQAANGDFKIYINGELDNSGSFNDVLNYFNEFRIGNCNNGNGFPWNDKIDDVGVWRKVLTECEVKSLFHSGNPQDTIQVQTCQSFTTSNGSSYTVSGIYFDTLLSVSGCDSLIQIDLTILEPSFDTLSISGCDYVINPSTADTIFSSGQYLDTLINASGCDSIVTLNATVFSSTTYTEIITSCDSLTWIDGLTYYSNNNSAVFTNVNSVGCDSIITLDLTINQSASYTDIQEACNEFTWIDGNTYTSSNNSAQVTFLTVNGCDSVVTLDLTILNADTSVTSLPPSLEANADSATYQWIDCGTSLPIDSATSKLFVAQSNGSYALVVTQNGCTDTSSCYQIYNVGMESLNGIEASVFPNPSSNEITIQCSGDFDFELLSIDGRTVLSGSGLDAVNCELAEFPRGQYTIVVSQAGKADHYKVILN